MKILLGVLCLFCLGAMAQDKGILMKQRQANRMGNAINNGRIVTLSHTAMTHALARAEIELHDKGFDDLADRIAVEWESTYSALFLAVYEGRGIGDHPDQMISEWVEKTYDEIEMKLTRPVCVALHLSDIKTINTTLKLAIKPCTFGMNGVLGSRKDEWRRNMVTDGVYPGLFSVVTYWVSFIGCEVLGGSVICGVIASGAELLMKNVIGGPLSDRIWERKCAPQLLPLERQTD